MKYLISVHRGRPKPFDAILENLTGLSPDEVATIIRMGGAYVGKYRCKQGNRGIRDGESVSVYYRLPIVMEPVAFDPTWIVEDNQRFLVANKPSGIPTQGRRDADYMAFYEILKQNVSGYLGLHHRLDQDTSGLMLFTRDKTMNKDMSRLFSDGLIEKRYLAVVAGTWPGPWEPITVDVPIATRHGGKGTRHLVARDGKKAVTHIRPLSGNEHQVLVEARPQTGRTHQIRIHLAHLGLPLWGDPYYGGPERPGQGFLLHCRSLFWPECGMLPAGDFLTRPPLCWSDVIPAEWEDSWQ